MLHGRGFHTFDFSIGDYAYKRRLGAESGELFDLAAPLSPLGIPYAAYVRAKSAMRRYPKVERVARRLLKRESARQ
jgi:CelD/BcsL family acetyltransferase involved in cellulose biosynthesis